MKTELALREFLDSRISSNLSPRTIEWYEDRLLPFAKSCPNIPRRPEPIESFLASVQGSAETKRGSFNALRTFFGFICKRHKTTNPMDAVNPPRRPKTRMATLEANEIVTLLQLADGLRERAILTLIIDNGMRAGEVCSLLKHNIKQETVIVCGKTGWREVPISGETRELLLNVAATGPGEHVFHGHKGPLTRFGIYRIVREHMVKAGIKGPKLGSHRLRHAFGKNFLIQGGDLRSLQEIMGHTDIKTTQKYATLNLTDIIKKHQKFSPLKAVHDAEQEIIFTPEILKQAEAILKGRKSNDSAGTDPGHG
ncbi:MAG: tyrosine-type recombinase/integrase [Dehalococcoidales bacterium]|nr:tyrosine-type recombinase/integrase [Dehalococcoidales bacterium]